MYEFILPLPEKASLNKLYSGIHWAVRNQLKDLYHKSIAVYSYSKSPERPRLNFPVKVIYTFIWKSRPLDNSNNFFQIKMLEDGLRQVGILPDDTLEYVGEISSWGFVDKTLDQDYVHIKIEGFEDKKSQESHILSLISSFRKYN